MPAASGESPFCPHCGTPQLFLSLENQSPETGGEPPAGTPGAASTGALPPPRPQQVDWKMAIRCAATVAAVAGVLCLGAIRLPVLAPAILLWILSGSLITLSVMDDGCGLAYGTPSQGMGLRNMKYRASILGGKLTLEPGGKGAIVTCSFHESTGLPD